MSPDFMAGDFIITCRYPWQRLAIGDDVVINHSRYGIMVKRVLAIEADQYTLIGLHQDSISSQAIGAQQPSDIIGKVCLHIKRPRPNDLHPKT